MNMAQTGQPRLADVVAATAAVRAAAAVIAVNRMEKIEGFTRDWGFITVSPMFFG
jgi:hypothetical protein